MLRGGISLPLRDSLRGTFGRIDGWRVIDHSSIHGISMPLHNLLHAKFFDFFYRVHPDRARTVCLFA
jgi:hypothetical protein